MRSLENRTLVDMDGVVAAFEEQVIDELQKDYPEQNIAGTELLDFYVARNFEGEVRRRAEEIHNAAGFFLKLRVVEGSIEAWLKMQERGQDPTILSAPLSSNPTCKQDKLSWLEEFFVPHVGYSIIDEALILKDKVSVSGLALVDDRSSIQGSERASWEHILFTHDHNKLVTDKLRIDSWAGDKWIEILDMARDRAARRQGG
jgi:5'(3')-deoxyribonucleotidase